MQRWNSRYRFAWTPIITFGTRRLNFLEWVEANLDPLAFTDAADSVGVAVGDARTRLTVTARGMTLEDGSTDPHWLTKLEPAIAGVFEVMQPRDTALSSASVAWSHPLEDEAYDAAASAFARRVAGIPAGSSYVPWDASALMDVTAGDVEMQVEWGVVAAHEIIERVTRPTVGRIHGGRVETSLTPMEEPLAPVSLFFDSFIHEYDVPREITGAANIIETIADADAVSEKFATELASSWQSKGEMQA